MDTTAAMSERDIDISPEFAKPWADEIVRATDGVVSLGCGDTCPVFPGKRYLDWTRTTPPAVLCGQPFPRGPDPAGAGWCGSRQRIPLRSRAINERIDPFGLQWPVSQGVCRVHQHVAVALPLPTPGTDWCDRGRIAAPLPL
ncbi:low molecular weight phosphatase family protein [Streptomyces mirabilis]|uniref:hypothetical protein n=1 Tax=Streptomyces mirabilis TaxID=68239 RepID=UPI0036871A39